MKTKKIFTFLFSIITLTSIQLFCEQNYERPMVVVIPSYNNINYYYENLTTLADQSKNYSNWRAIYINDASTDGTGYAVKKFIKENNLSDKVKLIENTQNMGAMYNLYTAITSCKDNEIILTLDGDDKFANDKVLFYINEAYSDGKTWLTYGQYIVNQTGQIGHCCAFPNYIIEQNLFRNYTWLSSQLRTFYAGLFKKIKKEDLMKDEKFFAATSDLAMMFPMLEMAGLHIKFIDKVLYIVNQNPISDTVIRGNLQAQLDIYIRNKEKYKKIETI